MSERQTPLWAKSYGGSRGIRVGFQPFVFNRRVLERRGGAMLGNHVRPTPGACRRVGIRVMSLNVSLPRAQDMPDLVGDGREYRGLVILLKERPVKDDGPEMGLPGFTGLDATVPPLAADSHEVLYRDMDLKPGAGCTAFPDSHLAR